MFLYLWGTASSFSVLFDFLFPSFDFPSIPASRPSCTITFHVTCLPWVSLLPLSTSSSPHPHPLPVPFVTGKGLRDLPPLFHPDSNASHSDSFRILCTLLMFPFPSVNHVPAPSCSAPSPPSPLIVSGRFPPPMPAKHRFPSRPHAADI